jgi:hypothetical protein
MILPRYRLPPYSGPRAVASSGDPRKELGIPPRLRGVVVAPPQTSGGPPPLYRRSLDGDVDGAAPLLLVGLPRWHECHA